jgi:hypothetical protein
MTLQAVGANSNKYSASCSGKARGESFPPLYPVHGNASASPGALLPVDGSDGSPQTSNTLVVQGLFEFPVPPNDLLEALVALGVTLQLPSPPKSTQRLAALAAFVLYCDSHPLQWFAANLEGDYGKSRECASATSC